MRVWFSLLMPGLLVAAAATHADERPVVIAHRGASGYLPEHTLPAKAMAYAMGADFIEQDCVLSKDDHAIVLHDVYLDTVTDVAHRFPDRARSDGRYYALDFTLAEIQTLRASERIDRKTGQRVFPGRFPFGKSTFRVPTLAEEIELIQGLNASTGRTVGIYPEIKEPNWHRSQGHDLSKVVLKTLARYGYTRRSDPVYVQCFDEAETRRLRNELKTDLKLIQLIGRAVTDAEIESFADYADGIGPPLSLLVKDPDARQPVPSSVVATAHRMNLTMHPWTLRQDDLPPFAEDLEALSRFVFLTCGADGAFSDFPDKTAAFVRASIEPARSGH